MASKWLAAFRETEEEAPLSTFQPRAVSAVSANSPSSVSETGPIGTNGTIGTPEQNQKRPLADGDYFVASEDLDERAALVEYGANVPRAWAEGYAALSSMPEPTGFSPERWRRVVDAVGVFLDKWAAEAIACGWTDLDIFGVDADAPDRRFDCMGLIMLLDRCEIVGIDEHGADLAMGGGVMQRYRRKPRPVGTVPLWQLTANHGPAQ